MCLAAREVAEAGSTQLAGRVLHGRPGSMFLTLEMLDSLLRLMVQKDMQG